MQDMTTTVKNLNKQIELELMASHFYLQMSIWCNINNYKGFAKYFLNASNEERSHAMKVKEYAINFIGSFNNGYLQISSLAEAPQIISILDAMKITLELELKVTQSINDNIRDASEIKDYATVEFYNPMAIEQINSMQEVNYIIDKIKSCDNDYAAIMLLDEEVGDMK